MTLEWDEGTLQAYLDDELSEEERSSLEAYLEDSQAYRDALEQMRASQAFLQEKAIFLEPGLNVQPDLALDDVYRRFADDEVSSSRELAQVQQTSWFSSLAQLFSQRAIWVTAFAAVLAVIVLPRTSWFGESFRSKLPVVPSPLVAKGLNIKMLHTLREEPHRFSQTYVTRSGTKLAQGDLIQFTYVFPSRLHVLLGGMNQQGELFPLVVSKTGQSVQVKSKAGAFPERKSFKLDNYLGQERYFFVVSTKPFAWHTIKAKLTKSWQKHKDLQRSFSLPKPWQISSFFIVKTKR